MRHEASSIATLPAHLKVEAIASYEVALHGVFLWNLGLAMLLICVSYHLIFDLSIDVFLILDLLFHQRGQIGIKEIWAA